MPRSRSEGARRVALRATAIAIAIVASVAAAEGPPRAPVAGQDLAAAGSAVTSAPVGAPVPDLVLAPAATPEVAALVAGPDAGAAQPITAAVPPAAPAPTVVTTAASLPLGMALPPDLTLRPPMTASARRSYLWPAGETLVITAVTMAWNKYVGDASWANITPDTVARNVRGRWVFDEDQYWVNEFAHPYQGTWSYTAARSAGLSFWQSFPYAFLASLIWEYAGETTNPAINDQVTTPIAGTVLGEILFRASGMLLREPGFLRALGAGILAPVSPFNRAVLGDWTEKPTNPAELQARVGALGLSEHRGAAASWSSGVVPDFGIRLIYGPAGDPDTRLEKPFDHFDLDASYGATGDAIASIVARGVLWGRQYEGAGERGLWGIYLGYDFFTPGTFRVSTTYLGVGASTRFFLSPSVVLDLDAVGAGIPVGAAGRSYVPPGSKRDYHFGAGVQGDVEGRLRLGDRAEIGVGARYYLLYGQGDYAADERVGYYGASALVRIFGPHAIGAEGILLSRRATAVPNDPPPSQDGQLLRVFYAYSPARRIAPVEVPDLGRP